MANPRNQPRNIPDPPSGDDVDNEENNTDQDKPNREGTAPADDSPPPKIKSY